MSLSIVMSDEAVREIDDYLNSPMSMVDANGNLIKDLASVRGIKFSFYCVTWHPLTDE